MSEPFRDRPRPPLRETVCDIDRDILRLVKRRSAFIKKMQGRKENPRVMGGPCLQSEQ